jgi:hypothetical protein
MAKRKPSARTEVEHLKPFPIENIPRDPDTLAKIAEDVLGAMAESNNQLAAKQSKEAIAKAGERKPKRAAPKQADVTAVADRLDAAARTLLVIHHLAEEGFEDTTGNYLEAIQELVRSTYKGVDACIERLTGKPTLSGYFATEFDGE